MEIECKKIFVFGNPDLDIDSLPLKILPELRQNFPEIFFEVKDPNEEWEVPEEMIVLDAALGINKVMVFESPDKFSAPPRVSMHDFDALSNIRYLFKLGKIKKVKIIALPVGLNESQTITEVSKILKQLTFQTIV